LVGLIDVDRVTISMVYGLNAIWRYQWAVLQYHHFEDFKSRV